MSRLTYVAPRVEAYTFLLEGVIAASETQTTLNPTYSGMNQTEKQW